MKKKGDLSTTDKKGRDFFGHEGSLISSNISYSYGPSRKDYNRRKEILQ